jgi:hypothetical protein
MRTEGSTDKPYVENPNEHLKEVHWGGGLAVHFGLMEGPPADPPPPARERSSA